MSFNLGQSDRIHGYYALQEDLRQEPILQGNTIPGFGDTRQSRRQIMTLNYTHVFGPALTNEARFGYNRIHITFTPNALLNPASFGINNGVMSAIGLPEMTIRAIGLDFGGPFGFPQGRGDTTAAFSDALLYLRGKHSWAFGGEIRRFYNDNFNLDTGTFSFPDVTHFINGQADRFTVTLGNGASRIVQPAWGAFVQDNYKILSNLTVELGLRYDWNFAPSEARNRFVVFVPGTGGVGSLVQVGTNRLRTVYQDNRKNVQPRLGFAWDPFKDGKTSVRAGYAVLVDQPVTNLVTGTTTNPPFSQPTTFTSTSTTPFVTFANALATAGPAGLSPVTVNPDFKNPYVQSWNLNIQRAITPTLGLTVGYFGSKGTHLRILRNINQRINGGARPFTALASTSPIKPGVTLNNISEGDSGGNSSYNALWVTMNKRLARGLQFNASYTFSKSIDYNSVSSQGRVTTQDSFNIRNDRGLSDFDVRHRFVISGFYELPLKGNRFSEGWELGTIIQAQSGNPLTVIANNSGFTGNFTLRPDIIGSVGINGDPSEWYRSNTVLCNPTKGACPAGFVAPGSLSATGSLVPTHFGNLGRNTFIGPGFTNVDLSLIKNTKISERFNLQFRAEAFDLFNHPNFGDPGPFGNATLAAVISGTPSSFGTIRSTRVPTGDFGSSRQMQISLRLLF